jgi:hypothetical protein
MTDYENLEQWEAEAEAFYRATGYLRPGKDYGALSGHDHQREIERKAAWRAWSGGRDFASLTVGRVRLLKLRAKGVVDADNNLDCWDTEPFDICHRHVAALNAKDSAAMWRVVDLYAAECGQP